MKKTNPYRDLLDGRCSTLRRRMEYSDQHHTIAVSANAPFLASQEITRAPDLGMELYADAPFPIHVIDAEGTVEFVNRAECRLLGYDYRQIVGRPVWELVEPGMREASRKAVQAKLAGEAAIEPFERSLLDREGRMRTFEIHEVLLRNSDHSPIRGIRSFLVEITERVTAEKLLRRSDVLLRQSEHIARIGSWEQELETGEEYWSAENRSILGLPVSSPIDLERFLTVVHQEDLASLAFAIEHAIMKGGMWDMEFRLMRPDGTMRHCRALGKVVTDEAGKPVRLVGTTQDITERKVIADELSATTRVLRFEGEVLRQLAHRAPLKEVLTSISKNIDLIIPRTFSVIHLLRPLSTVAGGNSILSLVAPEACCFQHAADRQVGNFVTAAISQLAAEFGPHAATPSEGIVVVEDTRRSPLANDVRAGLADRGILSTWAAPIRNHRRHIQGVLTVYSRESRRPSTAELSLLEAGAELASIAIDRQQ